MNILLTGGAGYIGSHTAVELFNAGYRVVIADNLCNGSEEAVRRVERITGKASVLYKINVADKTALERVFQNERIDAVIHLAGLKAVGESVQLPLNYYSNNIEASLTLLKVMEEFDVKNLIFSSSAVVYGDPERVPVTEDMPVGQCTNPYGWTKFMIEQIIRDYCRARPDFSAILLRYFNPVGAHKSGLIGEDPHEIPNNLMPYISQVAIHKREQLSIFGNDYPTPDGTGMRDYIHVVDLAKGHLAALRFGLTHPGAEAFNLGTGKSFSVLNMVYTFQQVNKVKIPFRIVARRSGDVAACYADVTKAEKHLGWTAEYTLEDMCRDTWNWQKQNPEGYCH